MPPPKDAELPEIVELVTASVPELLKAPPLPEVCAPETVTPEINRLPPEAMLKILKPPRLPLMLRLLAPRPAMFTVPLVPPLIEVFASLMGSEVARVMV